MGVCGWVRMARLCPAELVERMMVIMKMMMMVMMMTMMVMMMMMMMDTIKGLLINGLIMTMRRWRLDLDVPPGRESCHRLPPPRVSPAAKDVIKINA